MSTKEAKEKKKETKKAVSGRPSFGKALGTGMGKLWIFFILVIILCVNICYLISIRFCLPSYYFERVYSASGADSLAASFTQTMDGDGLRQELLDRITPQGSEIPAEITLQSEENSDLLTIRVTSDNYYNAKEIMELFCTVYPEYAGSASEKLSGEPVSETDSGTDIFLPFLERTAVIGGLAGAAVCLIWLIGYAVNYRKTFQGSDKAAQGNTGVRKDQGKTPAQTASRTQAAEQAQPARSSMKCLLELPRISLWDGKKASAQKMLFTSRYADEDFQTRILDFSHSVQKRMDERGSVILLVTSSVAGEGKSVIAANLALSLADKGNSVVLMETNFGDTSYPLTVEGPGLLDYAEGREELENILYLARKNLVLLTPGSAAGEPEEAELMASGKIRELLAQLADTVDYVILDTAPLVEAPETADLLEEADEILYVARADQDDQTALKEGLEILAGREKTVLGFVMNYSQREA